MKKKSIYKWMAVIATVTVLAFAAIYYLNLQNKVTKVTNVVRNGPPSFNKLIYGESDKALDKPMDVTKIGELLYVTDTNNKQVQIFDTSGTQVSSFGKEGTGKGEFKFPYGITGDKDGNVYVADMFNGKISIYKSKGEFIKYFEVKDKKDALQQPAGLRIFDNKLYVTDVGTDKVTVFNLDGTKLLEIKTGATPKEILKAPNAVTVDKNGNIYIADSRSQRILEYDKSGKYLHTINGSKEGKGSSVFVNPRGLGIDSQGVLYIVDSTSSFIYAFDRNGKKLYSYGGIGDENEQFYLPNGLFVDENDYVYITDTTNSRVAVYY